MHKFPSTNVHDVIGKLQNQAWPFYSMDGRYLNSQVSPASTNANNILRSIHKSPICINMFRSKFSQTRTTYTLHFIRLKLSCQRASCNIMAVLCFPFIDVEGFRSQPSTFFGDIKHSSRSFTAFVVLYGAR